MPGRHNCLAPRRRVRYVGKTIGRRTSLTSARVKDIYKNHGRCSPIHSNHPGGRGQRTRTDDGPHATRDPVRKNRSRAQGRHTGPPARNGSREHVNEGLKVVIGLARRRDLTASPRTHTRTEPATPPATAPAELGTHAGTHRTGRDVAAVCPRGRWSRVLAGAGAGSLHMAGGWSLSAAPSCLRAHGGPTCSGS